MRSKLVLLASVLLISLSPIRAQMEIGVNAANINPNSIPKLESAKGIVFPRVLLTNVTLPAPLAAGLLKQN